MITIEELELIDIVAKSSLEDENTKNIYKAISYAINIRNKQNKDMFFQDLETMSESEIDELLWEYDVKNVISTSDIEIKIEILKKALTSNFNRGTVGSVKNISEIFFGNADIYEWFEYGGNPGYFKISTTSEINNEETFIKILNVVNEYKNIRSWFDGFRFIRETVIENKILNLFNSKVINSINMREFELPWFNNDINLEIVSNTTMLNNLGTRE